MNNFKIPVVLMPILLTLAACGGGSSATLSPVATTTSVAENVVTPTAVVVTPTLPPTEVTPVTPTPPPPVVTPEDSSSTDEDTSTPTFAADSGQNRSYPLAWSADGALLLAANRDNVFKVWEGHYTILRQAVAGHTDWIQALALSANGHLLATAGRDTRLRFWVNTDGKLGGFGEVNPQIGTIRALNFSPAGDFLAVAGSHGQIQVWDERHRQIQATWNAHTGIIYAVQYSPDGQWLATAGADGQVRLWNATTGEKLADLGRHAGAVYQLVFVDGGKQLLSAGGDGKILRWDVNNRQALGTVGEHGTAAVYALALAADGVTVASGDADGIVKLWSLDAVGNATRQISVAGSGAIHALAFEPTTGYLGISSEDGILRVWDVLSGELQRMMATAGTEGPSEPDAVDHSADISKQLAGLLFDGMRPVLAMDELLVQPERFANVFLLGINQAPLDCPKGTYRFTFSDTDADQRYASVGDDFAVATTACQEDTVALTGDYGLQLTATDRTASVQSTGTDVRLQGLVVDDGHFPVTADGRLHFEVNEPLDGVSTITTDMLSQQLGLVIKDKGTYAFTQLQVQMRSDPVSEERTVTYAAELALQGLRNSFVSNGHYVVTTLEPFKFSVFDAYPYAGKWKIQQVNSHNNGQITLITVLNSQKVRIETDKRANGVIEHTEELEWQNLSEPLQGN